MSNQSTIKLKVCGMRDAQNILEVAKLQPDFMGFIFYDKSPRYVGIDFKISADFPSYIARVGVFVNEKTDVMVALSKQHQLEYLQLHGDETVDQVKELKGLGYKVIKVFSVGEEFNFEMTRPFQSYCSYFLFDTKGKYYGGNAKTFDWSQLKKYDQRIPFFLSGGINPDNAEEIIELEGMNLFALDVNSGVEVSPGVKSIENVKKLIKNVRLL